MLRITAYVLLAFAVACSPGDRKAQLEKLKKERDRIGADIARLEEEMKTSGAGGQAERTRAVSVAGIQPAPFVHFLEVQGRVDAEQNVTVSPHMGGTVSAILVREGESVKKGQLLAEMDNRVILQSMEELRTALELAVNLYNRQKNLWDQKIGTEVQYLTAKANRESLGKKLVTLQEQLEMSRLRAPLDGTVDAVDIKAGQTAMPGMPAVRVVNFAKMKVKAEVAEAYASAVQKGDSVLVRFPDLKKEIPSRVNYVSRVINNLTRTFTVEIQLDEASHEYRPNMIAVVRIMDYRSDSALTVPVNLVQSADSARYVFVVSETDGKKTARRRAVRVGQVYNGMAEITEGLLPGDLVVTAGYRGLNENDLITY